MVSRRFTAAIVKEGKWYVAQSIEVGVTSQGKTWEEAFTNLREALELYFENEGIKKASGSFSVDPVILEQDEDEKFVITCPVLEGCHSQGNTFEEAVNNIREAIELCLEEKANG